MEFLKNVCWEGFSFGLLIIIISIILGPDKETKFYKILWKTMIVIGGCLMLLSLITPI